jgi:hypothetical protein
LIDFLKKPEFQVALVGHESGEVMEHARFRFRPRGINQVLGAVLPRGQNFGRKAQKRPTKNLVGPGKSGHL